MFDGKLRGGWVGTCIPAPVYMVQVLLGRT